MIIQQQKKKGPPVLVTRDRQRDPVVGVCPRCGRERYGWGTCPWWDCVEPATAPERRQTICPIG